MGNKDAFIAYRAIEQAFNEARSRYEVLKQRISDAEFGIGRSSLFEIRPVVGFAENQIVKIPASRSPLTGKSTYAGAQWSADYDADPDDTFTKYQALREEYFAAKSEFERLVSEKAAAWKEFQRQKVTLTVSQLAAIADVDVSYVRAEIANGRLMAKKLDEDQPNSPHVISGFDALGWLDKPHRGSRRKAN